jgi:UDP-glucose 4-epimerase
MTSYERVVVTGGAGLIGSHIVDLLAEGQRDGTYGEIVVLDNLTRGRLVNLEHARSVGKITLVEGDITDPDLVQATMDGADLLFHLAAIRITHCVEDPRLAMDVLGNGTFNVAQAAVRAKVKKVVASSTASIYGQADIFPTREDHHPYNNRTLYGAIKIFNEGLLRSFNEMYDLPYIALRYFNVYGARMDIHGAYTEVLIRWMNRLASGESPLIFGDGTQSMDFVYVTDIARANIAAAQSTVSDEVFNIASATETSLNELAHALARVMGSDLTPEYGPERVAANVPRRLADVSKAADLLGWKAEVDLDAGLRALVTWWEQNRDTELGTYR